MAGALKHFWGEIGYRAAETLGRDVVKDTLFR
jgi:hypothetical protein